MLYLDFSRQGDQWVPNIQGGRENLGAIQFIKQFNERVHTLHPGVITIAEESTDWQGVSAENGLGFDFKWNMGWMHDTLQYMSMDPVFRAFHHGTLTFSMLYAFSEKFVLPFSHDEVVHLKKSMLDKMPGDVWQKFANLRTLYAYQYSHPGKKLLFMGCEFGQWHEWTEEHSLDWHLVQPDSQHGQLQAFVRELNHLYKSDAALYSDDQSWAGFEWLEVHDSTHSILSYIRRSRIDDSAVIVIANFTPVVRQRYRLGVPYNGTLVEILNSDDEKFGGSGVTNNSPLVADDQPWRGQPYSIQLTLPPLGVTFLKPVTEE
jgi:1,4-alpha-glucan branching enzyme